MVGKARIQDLPRGQGYEPEKWHWCRFVGPESHSLKEATGCNFGQLARQKQSFTNGRKRYSANSLKAAKDVAATYRQNGTALAVQPNDIAHKVRTK